MNDYKKGYLIGYIKAVRDMRNQLELDDEHPLRLVTLVNWITAKEVEYTEILYAPTKASPKEDK